MDDISYLLETVHDVVIVLDRLVNTSNGEREFQLTYLNFVQFTVRHVAQNTW